MVDLECIFVVETATVSRVHAYYTTQIFLLQLVLMFYKGAIIVADAKFVQFSFVYCKKSSLMKYIRILNLV